MHYFSICFRYAAEKAGFRVLRMIQEPSAAALAYGKNENLIEITLILTGEFLHVAIIKLSGNYITVTWK